MLPKSQNDRRLGAAWRRLLREEEGVALVLAILTMLVLTISLTTVIFVTAAGARDAHRTNAGQKASALAESGINNALAVLNANYPGTVGYPGDYAPCCRRARQSCRRVLCRSPAPIRPEPSAGRGRWTTGPPATGPIEWDVTATATVRESDGSLGRAVTPNGQGRGPGDHSPLATPIGQNNPLNFIYGNAISFQQR